MVKTKNERKQIKLLYLLYCYNLINNMPYAIITVICAVIYHYCYDQMLKMINSENSRRQKSKNNQNNQSNQPKQPKQQKQQKQIYLLKSFA